MLVIVTVDVEEVEVLVLLALVNGHRLHGLEAGSRLEHCCQPVTPSVVELPTWLRMDGVVGSWIKAFLAPRETDNPRGRKAAEEEVEDAAAAAAVVVVVAVVDVEEDDGR